MASPSKVVLGGKTEPVLAFNVREDSARRTSDLLQADFEKHHVYFNQSGFHNHIVHHLLTIYALGASPVELQTAYDNNATYQRPPVQASSRSAKALDDPAIWKRYLGDENHYPDFILHFQREMDETSSAEVVNKYLFAGDERADDLLIRLYAGLLHPLIHLGFGMEFQQPLVLVEALAQAAIHENGIGKTLLPAERAAKQSGRKHMERSIASLVDECMKDKKSGRSTDIINLLSQVVVAEDQIEEQMAEMMNAALYFAASAQRSKTVGKIDFFLLHCVTSATFFPAILGPASPLSTAAKVRLLEYKMRMDVGIYDSCGAPELRLEQVRSRRAKRPSGWDALFERARRYPDDGHTSKFIRAVAATEQQCKKYEADTERFRIRGDDYLTIAHMVMDNVEGLEDESSEPRWTRPSHPVALL